MGSMLLLKSVFIMLLSNLFLLQQNLILWNNAAGSDDRTKVVMILLRLDLTGG